MHGAGLQPGKTRGRAAFRHGEGPHGSTGPGRSRRNTEARRQGSRPLALFEAPNQRPPVAHELPAHAPAALLAPRHKAPRLKAVAALGAVHLHFRKAWRAESARRKSPAISIACCILGKPFRALAPCHAHGFRGQKLRLRGPDFQRGSQGRTGLAPGKASASHRTGPGLEGLLLSGRASRAKKAGSYGAACLFQGLGITSFPLTLQSPHPLPGKRRSGPAPSGRSLRVPGVASDRRGEVLSHQSRFLPPALPRVRSGRRSFGRGPDFHRGSQGRTGLAPGKASASHRAGLNLEGLLLSGRAARAKKTGSYGAACLFQTLGITSFPLTLRSPRPLPGKRSRGPAPSGRSLRAPGVAPDKRGEVLSHQSRFLPPAQPRVRSGGKRFGLGKGVRPGHPGLPARLRVRPRGALGRAGLNRKGFRFPALGSWGIAWRCFKHA